MSRRFGWRCITGKRVEAGLFLGQLFRTHDREIHADLDAHGFLAHLEIRLAGQLSAKVRDTPVFCPKKSSAENDLFLHGFGTVEMSVRFHRLSLTEDFSMVRRILALGLVCGSLAFAQPANAQGLYLGGIGFGSPGFYGSGFGTGFSPYGFGNAAYFGGYAPARFGYPVAVRPVYVARPVVYGSVAPAYVPRPAVRVPLNRAYRRVWRRGW